MPVHDWICESCGHVLPDQYNPYVSAIAVCPECSFIMVKSWARDSRPLFQPFTVDYGKGDTEISSLAQLRQIERDSEKACVEGKESQIVFRHFANDETNYDRNTLEGSGVQQKIPRKRPNITPKALGPGGS
jgi:hypothetical protein